AYTTASPDSKGHRSWITEGRETVCLAPSWTGRKPRRSARPQPTTPWGTGTSRPTPDAAQQDSTKPTPRLQQDKLPLQFRASLREAVNPFALASFALSLRAKPDLSCSRQLRIVRRGHLLQNRIKLCIIYVLPLQIPLAEIVPAPGPGREIES